MPRRTYAHWGAAMAMLALAGCSSSGGGFSGIGAATAPYQHSNAIAPSGYSESLIAPNHYRIEVRGPLTASRQRLEKIAMARAAEIGKENRLGYFKIDGVQLTTNCSQYTSGGKPGSVGSGEKKKSEHAVLTAEVSYTKTPPDQSYIDSKSFDQLRAELDLPQSEAVPMDPAAVLSCS